MVRNKPSQVIAGSLAPGSFLDKIIVFEVVYFDEKGFVPVCIDNSLTPHGYGKTYARNDVRMRYEYRDKGGGCFGLSCFTTHPVSWSTVKFIFAARTLIGIFFISFTASATFRSIDVRRYVVVVIHGKSLNILSNNKTKTLFFYQLGSWGGGILPWDE
jgi:hypothetical protein